MKPNNQLSALSAQAVQESRPIIAEDYREAAQRDKTANYNLFFVHKFDGDKQESIFNNKE